MFAYSKYQANDSEVTDSKDNVNSGMALMSAQPSDQMEDDGEDRLDKDLLVSVFLVGQSAAAQCLVQKKVDCRRWMFGISSSCVASSLLVSQTMRTFRSTTFRY